MSFDDLLNASLIIKRNVAAVVPIHDPADPTDGDPILDDYGQPTYVPAIFATVEGRIRPLTARETPLVNQAGAVVSTHRGYIWPLSGLTTADWIEMDGVRFDITGIADGAGAGHHLELALTEVA
jgi:Phage head-tail joining protein